MNFRQVAISLSEVKMGTEVAKGVWRGKWAEVTASFNSDDENEEGNDLETSTVMRRQNEEPLNGNEIRRSARPRRIAAKIAEADFSSMSGEGRSFEPESLHSMPCQSKDAMMHIVYIQTPGNQLYSH